MSGISGGGNPFGAAIDSSEITDGTVALADLANLATDSLIGRTTAGTGVPEAVTFTDFAQALAAFTPARGATLGFGQVSENLTIAAGATTTSNIQIPAGAFVVYVGCFVSTVIPTAATFQLGISGGATRYGNGISTAAGSGNVVPLGTAAGSAHYNTATAFLVTPNLTPADNSGRLSIVCIYLLGTAPTS